jgi:antitoxin (DNA-binding transcriptional repressor) of toxin-antitoxin stability system
VKRASITEAKNQLSALIDRVRRGERVVIEDRGVPVARLDAVFDLPEDDEGRVARLERAGLARRPDAPVPRAMLKTPPPRPARGARLSRAVLDERAEGR